MKKRKLKFSAQDEKQRDVLQISKWNKPLNNTKFLCGMYIELSSSKQNQEKLCYLRKLQANQMLRFQFPQLRCQYSFLENDNLDITLPRS